MTSFKKLPILILSVFLIYACSSEEKIEFPEGLDVTDTEVGTGQAVSENDFVKVHYTGYLAEDNTKFDSSHDRDTPFRFQVGSGQVISGWEKGLLGMREGGSRTLTLAPEFGYGERGAGNVIPPNATLIFEIELLEVIPAPTLWDYEEDELTETESGLRYKIVTEGDGDPLQAGDVAELFYAGFLENGNMFDSSVRNPSAFYYELGTGQAIPGWDEGVNGMRVGEERLLVIPSDLAYGESGVGDIIPPDATLLFTVRIEGIQEQ
jgi:peptidylprolyl isomerase